MSNKGIVIALVVLVVLVAFLIVTSQGDRTGSSTDDLTEGFESFKEATADISTVARLTIEKGEKKAELVRKGTDWVLASSYGYPASTEKVDKLLDELKDIDSGEKKGWSASSHPDFEVDARKGTRITLFDKEGQQLGSVVLGKNAPSRLLDARDSFARFGDEEVVFQVDAAPRSVAGGSGKELEKDYLLQDKLFEIGEDFEVSEAQIQRPDHNVVLERRWVEKPKESSEDDSGEEGAADADAEPAAAEGESEPEVEREEHFYVASGSESFEVDSSKKWQVRNYLNNKSLRVKEAVEPKEDLSEYGLAEPQLRVILKYRKKDDAGSKPDTVTILFGNAVKDEETGDDKAYYVTLGGEGGGKRVYTVEKWTYNNWAKDLADFKPEPPKEPETKEETKEEDSGTSTETEGAAGAEPAAPSTAPESPSPEDSGTTGAPSGGEAAEGSAEAGAPSAATPPEKIRARHILVAYAGALRAESTITRSKEEARKEAERLADEAQKAPARFAELARAHSDGPSGPQGGDLGPAFGPEVMDPAFSKAAFGLEVNEVSGVVETPFGFHIIQRIE